MRRPLFMRGRSWACRILGHRWERFSCWWNDDEWRSGAPPHVERLCGRCFTLTYDDVDQINA